MTTKPPFHIKRSSLREITQESMIDHAVPPTLRERLEHVADNAQAITMDAWWASEEGCGCLVGTARHLAGEKTDINILDSKLEWDIGIRFDELLHEAVGLHIDDPDHYSEHVVVYVDED
jgi:hypothetical protein